MLQRREWATVQRDEGYVPSHDWRRRGAANTPAPGALGTPQCNSVYFERQELAFCQVHAVNNAGGGQLLTGGTAAASTLQQAGSS